MHGSAQSDGSFPAEPDAPADAEPSSPGAVPSHGNGTGNLLQHELEATLQLLVERAQFITGATGTALALIQGEEMVCRASAGSSAPVVGARLQVRSGLTGESIARKQLLRCDNAETDPRVNLETCRELGIASIVVLPLLTRSGEIRGLFELFSDHAYAFEERDLIALERMGELTLTALSLADHREASAVVAAREPEPVPAPAVNENEHQAASIPPSAAEISPAQSTSGAVENPADAQLANQSPAVEPAPSSAVGSVAVAISETETTAAAEPKAPAIGGSEPASAAQPAPEESSVDSTAGLVPEAMQRVQKCASCGFPVSEGRSLCMDCEQKGQDPGLSETVPAEFVPAFLSGNPPKEESWLANHVNLLAVLVLILSIVVAVVVFR